MLTLEIYLFSNIADSYIYPYFSNNFYGPEHQMPQQIIFKNYFLIIISLTFLSSLILSIGFHVLYVFCGKGLKALIQKTGLKNLFQCKMETSGQ